MKPDGTPPGLGVQQLYEFASRDWVDLTDYLIDFSPYPDVSLATRKPSNIEASTTINRYQRPSYRVNTEGLVVMRSLLRKNNNTNIVGGDNILLIPEHIRPRHPQELRFFGGTCNLRYEPETGRLKISDVLSAQPWCQIYNVMYYID